MRKIFVFLIHFFVQNSSFFVASLPFEMIRTRKKTLLNWMEFDFFFIFLANKINSNFVFLVPLNFALSSSWCWVELECQNILDDDDRKSLWVGYLQSFNDINNNSNAIKKEINFFCRAGKHLVRKFSHYFKYHWKHGI